MICRSLAAATAAVLSIAACGGAEGEAGAGADLPPTDRDPPPYVPEPATEAHTGETAGIAMSGGVEQARAVALRFIESVRDGDREALEQLLAQTLGRARQRLAGLRTPREQMIDQLLDPRRRRAAPPTDAPLDQLIDPDAVTAAPLAQDDEAEALPEGYLPTDLEVTIPVRDLGRRFFGVTLQWAQEGRLVVRPGPDPRIVAL